MVGYNHVEFCQKVLETDGAIVKFLVLKNHMWTCRP